MPRFNETVQIQPMRAPSGAAQGAMSLADRLEAFKNVGYQALDIVAEHERGKSVKRGLKSAGEVEFVKDGGVTQSPKFKEESEYGGLEARTHNKALRSAYLASLDNDNREAVAGIFQENESDIIGFNEAIKGYTKGVLQGVDPSIRAQVKIDLERTASLTRINVQKNEKVKQEREAKIELSQNISSASDMALTSARNGEGELSAENIKKADLTIDAATEAGYITSVEATERKKDLRKGVFEQNFLRNVDNAAEEKIQKAMDLIDSVAIEVPDGFTPDEWKSTVIEAQQNVNRKNARLKQDLKKVSKELLLQESVDRGTQFLSPSVPADPAKGSQDRKDVNNAYKALSQEWNSLPPIEQFDKNIEFIKNTGIMPDGIIRGINASMRSGTPEQVVVMSKLVETISSDPNSANILRDVPTESRALAKQVSDSMESGIDPDVAIEIARKNTFGLTEAQKDDIKLQVREIKQKLPSLLEDMVDKEFDPSVIPFFGKSQRSAQHYKLILI